MDSFLVFVALAGRPEHYSNTEILIDIIIVCDVLQESSSSLCYSLIRARNILHVYLRAIIRNVLMVQSYSEIIFEQNRTWGELLWKCSINRWTRTSWRKPHSCLHKVHIWGGIWVGYFQKRDFSERVTSAMILQSRRSVYRHDRCCRQLLGHW